MVPGKGACDAQNKPLVELTGDIDDDARLTCDKSYLLKFNVVVRPGSTLTIDPGTTIFGDEATRGLLVVQPGAKIVARGTREAPIVFTSENPPEKAKPGDWGGVIVLGKAPINLLGVDGKRARGKVEGLTHDGDYGGAEANDSSGVLEHVRIEYSGTELGPNNEVNGLTLAGVGRGTSIDHVQIRYPADDCFEFFGGTADAKHLICQHPGDDGIDWDYGYTGRIQFAVVEQHPRDEHDGHGIEGDNDPNGSRNEPRSAPVLSNITLCGRGRALQKASFAIPRSPRDPRHRDEPRRFWLQRRDRRARPRDRSRSPERFVLERARSRARLRRAIGRASRRHGRRRRRLRRARLLPRTVSEDRGDSRRRALRSGRRGPPQACHVTHEGRRGAARGRLFST